MQIDLMGLIIKKLGHNYVNVISRDKRERKKRREKNCFLSGMAKEKKDGQKHVAKR